MSLRGHVENLGLPRNPLSHPRAHKKAQDYIVDVLESLGREVQLQSFPTILRSQDGQAIEGVNIVALPKRGPAHFLVVAHYDTVDHSPGADDNASAVAIALEIAANCPRVAVLFPDLEEQGLLGARAFVASGRLEHVPALVLESVGFWSHESQSQQVPEIVKLGFPDLFAWLGERQFRGDFWALLSLESELALAGELAGLLGGDGLLIPVPNRLLEVEAGKGLQDFGRSDHLAFWQAGRPCLMLTDTANFRNPNYHRPSDTIETLNFPQMERLSRRLLSFLSTPH